MFTVFIVDDDAVILDQILNTVPWMDNGFEVIGSSTSPLTAINEISRVLPDVVFTDLRMPEMDGVEMIRALLQKNISCEYVMLSAYGTFADSKRFFKESGFDYLLKPINQKEVQFVLEALAQKLVLKKPAPLVTDTINANPAFLDLVEYLNCNFRQKNTLESLSKRFSLGENYVCNLFAKHYNTTLTHYITTLRMRYALKQMQETTQAYKSIAVDCGYSDYYYFCRVFKAFYGASPTEYVKGKH